MRAANYPVRDVIAQSVVAHRMWREAFPLPRVERFITVEDVRLFHDPGASQIWSRIYVRRDVLRARKRNVTGTLRDSTLGTDFRAVVDPDPVVAGASHVFEQTNPTTYSGRPSDVVMDVVGLLRTRLWQTVLSAKPYRGYYLYLSPHGELRMPQWLSID